MPKLLNGLHRAEGKACGDILELFNKTATRLGTDLLWLRLFSAVQEAEKRSN